MSPKNDSSGIQTPIFSIDEDTESIKIENHYCEKLQ